MGVFSGQVRNSSRVSVSVGRTGGNPTGTCNTTTAPVKTKLEPPREEQWILS